ncbi:alpha/beta fold hydrolase [Dietzia psychralcaliphila]|uniref:alpha/beta fold hydrolase n=1 Tax=Dietzia psychralcaliphila TaxID=139021 RepID=UPI000D4B7A64|nr:alpha/beta fold hydrolase [Dietzia psychralcaliphila]PTM84825.1 TAP-like protein [Dietzia psychralcaliphila]
MIKARLCRPPAVLVVAAALVLGLTPTAATAPLGTAIAGVDTVAWTPCPADSAVDEMFGLPRADVLCSSVSVPVDHDVADGRRVDVEVRRITATGDRAGAVFGNPGGPGADARQLWYSALNGEYDDAIDEVRRDHDLVIVQPRGLEGAGALECSGGGETVGTDHLARAKRCMDSDPEFVSSFTTENIVRDHEVVREAMGLERISFLGYSYGTALGMMYQTLFPDRIERMVLDSAVGPTDYWWYEIDRQQAVTRHQARDYVMQWIADHDSTYELGDTPLKVYNNIRALDRQDGSGASRFLPPPAQPGDGVPGSLATGSLGTGSVDGLATGSVRLDNAALASTGELDREIEDSVRFFALLDAVVGSPRRWSDVAWLISAGANGWLEGEVDGDDLEEKVEEQLAMQSEVPELTSDMETYLTILQCNETAPPVRNPLAPALLGSSDAVGSTVEDVKNLEHQTAFCPFPPSTVPPRIVANPMVAAPLVLQADHDTQTPGMFGPATAAATGGTLVRIRGTVHCHFDTGNPAVDEVVLNYLRTGEVAQGQYLDTPRPAPGPVPSDDEDGAGDGR